MLPFDRRAIHKASSIEVEEQGAMLALGALPLPERDGYIAHLEGCGFCRGLVSQYRSVADHLPNALEEPAASPALKGRVLAQARAEVSIHAGPSTALPMEKRRAWMTWQWPGWLTPVPTAAIGLLVVAVVGLAAWNVGLSTKLKDQETILVQQRQLLGAAAAGGRISHLAGTKAAPKASATLVQDPAGGRSFLLLKSLPTLPTDREYQIWRIRGSQPVGVGTFGLTRGAEQLVVIEADFTGADAVGVSVEPRGGSPAPTGPIVLLGSF